MKLEILLDHLGIVNNKPNILFGAILKAGPARGPLPLPAVYCLLIDKSASMFGAPLDLAKAFTREFIRHLPANALLAIVTFEDSAEILFELDEIDDEKQVVECIAGGIECGNGASNFSGGWLFAREVLAEAPAEYQRRLIFLTDGEQTEGISDNRILERIAAECHREGIGVATVACGEANTPLLAQLALAAGGHFHEARSNEDLHRIVAAELGGLLPVAAQNIRLRLKRLEYCDSIEPLGDHRDHAAEMGPHTVEYQVRDLLAGEERSVCFNLQVASFPCVEGEPHLTLEGEPLLELELLYDAVTPEGVEFMSASQVIYAEKAQPPPLLRKVSPTISFL